MSLYLRQLQLGPMKNFVYLLGPKEGHHALVVDPAWDVPAIERQLEADGKELAGAFVTHHHGDHTNGLDELLGRHDVPVFIQRAEIDFAPTLRRYRGAVQEVDAGSALDVGGARFLALLTPGHTPGSQCLLAEGSLVAGDTLFVNHCGRCDLPGGDPEAMYRSLTDVLQKLPPDTRLLPGHDYGDVAQSTLERERAQNPYLRFSGLKAFVDFRMKPRK
jgi:glyoxylase-like metal-dependent hydrolase (beta-lactamase superfamily II)